MASLEFGTSDDEILLRAERSGTGSGRMYTIAYAATDASGNTASALAYVTVPHDQGGGPEPLEISVEPTAVPGAARLYWNAVGGARWYDLIAGNVEDLRVDAGRINLGAVRVPARRTVETSWIEEVGALVEGMASPNPAPGRAYFYLLQYRDDNGPSGFGSATVPWPREPASCIDGCPGL
jgi:hypothetical protein